MGPGIRRDDESLLNLSYASMYRVAAFSQSSPARRLVPGVRRDDASNGCQGSDAWSTIA